ncbi:MAG: DNA mismatch repair protein MutS [Alphaproteobacteria bacterium]|jgi:DNA mismatch repair protein MutS|nr:DNA mismatch repair protein MutS [Alphaproteobacteria bacterium]MDP6590402.1 DNA mismatch repair protein MutS [Alphaproteobacteria bacterium]MDP6819377.1 DNA mismatch repair protein MutS [Alphaproteobacteria bacterium]
MDKKATKSTPGEAANAAATPMMAQYLAIKSGHPDTLLFYRMGDFYELFFDDAVRASAALGIALTRRGKHGGADIPMCGVPVKSADRYLEKLIHSGFKVAVCEQTEDPAVAKKRGAKAVVAREVERLVTPGTLTEDSLLDARAANYLVALGRAEGRWAVAWCDMSTGEFSVMKCALAALPAVLARLAPGEILLSEAVLDTPDLFELFGEWKSALAPQPVRLFDSSAGERRLCALFGVAALDGFGDFGRADLAAAGAIVEYLSLTQKGKLPRLAHLSAVSEDASMAIDAATRRNLELTHALSGGRKGSLLAVIDRTVSAPGARLLHARLGAPLTDPEAISRRFDEVDFFTAGTVAREAVHKTLRGFPDVERALSRLTVGRGGPRDLAAVRDALALAPRLRAILEQDGELAPPDEAVTGMTAGLGQHDILAARLARALVTTPPLFIRDGGFIAKGYHAPLDEFVTLRDESRRLIANLETRYRAETDVQSLKVKHNNVLGFFIDVSERNAAKLGDGFIHRQTLASAVRFTTVELGELENKINNAAQKALDLEAQLFDQLLGEVTARAEDIARLARAAAVLDVASGLAQLAVERRYCRPLVDAGQAFDIRAGRHAVVEAPGEREAPATGADRFVPNDCDLGPQRHLWLVTGPNMAGKSTFLRQNALIAILAQMGSFVPAESAHIGIVDRLFSRVGAADDLARGRSTFMVEMIETAAILNLAGPRALVILDEIGRGTATFDGLSIAWAALEHLHEINRCRTLFATHYHELTALAPKLGRLSCNTMRVKEWQDDVVFLHEVVKGSADRSYGIHVARLAGLPEAVLGRAEEVLATLERGEQGGAVAGLAEDLPLFSAPRPTAATAARKAAAAAEAAADELRAALAETDVDSLSPRAALDLVYRLRAMLSDD